MTYRQRARTVRGFLILLVVLILLIPSATACVNLTPREANELITTTEELVILDLRVKSEYLREHIDRAVAVRDANSSLCAGKPVLIYDSHGTGCEAYNVTIGCTQLYHLAGGLQAWKDAGLPTVKTPIPTPPLPSFSTPAARTPEPSPAIATPSLPSFSTPASSTSELSPATPEPSPVVTAPPATTCSPAVASPQAPDFEAWSVVLAAIALLVCSRRKRRGMIAVDREKGHGSMRRGSSLLILLKEVRR